MEMPSAARSRDSPFAQAWVAAQAASAALPPMGSTIPVMLMIRPHLRARIPARNWVVSRRPMVNLRSMASCQIASPASGATGRDPPALFTRISSRPNRSLDRFGDRLRCRSLGQVGGDDQRLSTPFGADLIGQGAQPILPAGGDDEIHALPCHHFRDPDADPGAGAGDQANLSLELQVQHPCVPFNNWSLKMTLPHIKAIWVNAPGAFAGSIVAVSGSPVMLGKS